LTHIIQFTLIYNLFIHNKIKSCTIHLSQHPLLLSNPEHKVNKNTISAVTKSNKLSSIPGPGDYTVKKPLPKSATIAQTT